MRFNYDKLKQNRILDALELYLNTREIYILNGSEIDTITLGNGITFVVEKGELRYYGGLLSSTTKQMSNLTEVMKILQTAITLECPVFED
jgi:hypothetical protein